MREFIADAILFDCDGVLVDSLESAAIAWDRWAARYAAGFDFRTQIVHGVRAEDTVATLVDPGVYADALAALEAAEIETADGTRAIPGSVDLTRSIPSGSWAVVTSGTRALATARLAAAGHPSPSALIAAEDVTLGKPAPEPYERGADALGVDIAACIVFEDAPAGVRAARAAGARYVVGVGDHLEDEHVDGHVDDLTAVRWLNGRVLLSSR